MIPQRDDFLTSLRLTIFYDSMDKNYKTMFCSYVLITCLVLLGGQEISATYVPGEGLGHDGHRARRSLRMPLASSGRRVQAKDEERIGDFNVFAYYLGSIGVDGVVSDLVSIAARVGLVSAAVGVSLMI